MGGKKQKAQNKDLLPLILGSKSNFLAFCDKETKIVRSVHMLKISWQLEIK